MDEKGLINIEELFWKIAVRDDEEAFRILFTQFFTPLCVFAKRFVIVREDSEDIVQETFLKIWKNRKTIEINQSGRNFLVTAVKNSCIDFLRKKETESARNEVFAAENATDSVENLHAVRELEQELDTALAKLSDNVRTTYEMNRFDGMTYSEIAEEKHISVKTVEAYMTQALKFLRVELKDFLSFIVLFLW